MPFLAISSPKNICRIIFIRLYTRVSYSVFQKEKKALILTSAAWEVPVYHVLWCAITEHYCVASVSKRLSMPHPGNSQSESAGQTENRTAEQSPAAGNVASKAGRKG